MNDEAARQGRPATSTPRSDDSGAWRGRRRGFDFVASSPDGAWRVTTFYAPSRRAALELARDWAKRTGHAIMGEPEEGEAA